MGLEQAFKLFADLVRENHLAGRRSYGASLKPQLKRQTDGAFDETAVGFASFGAFMKAAADRGLVELHKAPHGPDSQAVPPNAQPIWDRSEDPNRDQHRVRHDLWASFVDWRPNMLRLYDRSAGTASMISRRPRRPEPAPISEIRARYDARPSDFVEISPAAFDTQLAWMRAFADDVGDTVIQTKLHAALQAEKPAREFAHAVTEDSEIARSWREQRVRHVVGEIRLWASRHGLKVDPFVEPTPAATERVPVDSDTGRVGLLRAALHRAIDVMPESELLRISLPVEYMLGKPRA